MLYQRRYCGGRETNINVVSIPFSPLFTSHLSCVLLLFAFPLLYSFCLCPPLLLLLDIAAYWEMTAAPLGSPGSDSARLAAAPCSFMSLILLLLLLLLGPIYIGLSLLPEGQPKARERAGRYVLLYAVRLVGSECAPFFFKPSSSSSFRCRNLCVEQGHAHPTSSS